MSAESVPVFLGAVALGIVHGAEPGHGWPIAASYALNRSNTWLSGLVASSLLGLGHLVSSLAVVGVFFLAKSQFELTQLNTPLMIGSIRIGGPVSIVAGVLLVLLGIREYRGGHSHGHDHHSQGHSHDHGHGHHGHSNDHHGDDGHDHNHGSNDDSNEHGADHDHDHGHSHDHDHLSAEDVDGRGLFGIVWAAFVLGFAHEEEFEIIGLCLGSEGCLALMLAYAVAVLVALVGLTMALIAGYQRYEDRVAGAAAYFPLVSAVVLVGMGVGFILGLF